MKAKNIVSKKEKYAALCELYGTDDVNAFCGLKLFLSDEISEGDVHTYFKENIHPQKYCYLNMPYQGIRYTES